jgi:hypothetical protein
MFVAERDHPDKSIFLIRTRAPFHLEEIAIQPEVVSTVSAVQTVWSQNASTKNCTLHETNDFMKMKSFGWDDLADFSIIQA